MRFRGGHGRRGQGVKRTRRYLLAALAILMIAAPLAWGQYQGGPGNTLINAPSAVTVSNTTTATTLYSQVLPAVVSERGSSLQVGATAIHVKLIGTISTNPGIGSAGSVNLGCNYGGSTATITLINALTLDGSLSLQPYTIDLWLRQQGSSQILQGRWELVNPTRTSGSQIATTTTTSATVTGTTSMSAAQTILCTLQWASTGASNSWVVNNGLMVIGE